MDIGNIIKEYRTKNNISLRDFAAKCGTSHSYISMLELGKNSKTGEPIIPSLTMLKKIATGLSMSVNELIAICDDMPITLSSENDIKNPPAEPQLTEGEEKLLNLIRLMPEEMKKQYTELLEATLKALGLIQ